MWLTPFFSSIKQRRDGLLPATADQGSRRCIDGCSLEFGSISMAVMAAMVIVSYILYTVSPETIQRHGADRLYFTGFWVVTGLLRYL
jgi:decaprenyl-phosphate phosphoribosyltransferase